MGTFQGVFSLMGESGYFHCHFHFWDTRTQEETLVPVSPLFTFFLSFRLFPHLPSSTFIHSFLFPFSCVLITLIENTFIQHHTFLFSVTAVAFLPALIRPFVGVLPSFHSYTHTTCLVASPLSHSPCRPILRTCSSVPQTDHCRDNETGRRINFKHSEDHREANMVICISIGYSSHRRMPHLPPTHNK
ncbi:MAG: hypothetical protein J3R72DRAFT_129192 [Linnemannia gamsii]|nr:MAG: hypothetical protein J3R72DRAFT_129192 [Linnemannia gamsii]